MGGEMTGQRTQAGEDLTLAEARKVYEIQLATQEQIGGAIKRVRNWWPIASGFKRRSSG